MPNKHLKIPQAICELVGQDLKDSPEWKRQISPGQNRFSFGCVGGRIQHRQDGAHLEAAQKKGSTKGQ